MNESEIDKLLNSLIPSKQEEDVCQKIISKAQREEFACLGVTQDKQTFATNSEFRSTLNRLKMTQKHQSQNKPVKNVAKPEAQKQERKIQQKTSELNKLLL